MRSTTKFLKHTWNNSNVHITVGQTNIFVQLILTGTTAKCFSGFYPSINKPCPNFSLPMKPTKCSGRCFPRFSIVAHSTCAGRPDSGLAVAKDQCHCGLSQGMLRELGFVIATFTWATSETRKRRGKLW